MRIPNRQKPNAPKTFDDEYVSILREYISVGGESTLGEAYALGRQAIAQQKSLVELAALHHDAIQKLMAETKGGSHQEKLLRASACFLAECLSPYEMAHRGFHESVKALRQLNQTLEEEIKRIAYSVHDESGQLLVAVHLALADLALELPESQKDRISNIEELLNQVEKQLRRYSHELRPTVLDDLGWIPAIRFLADALSKRAGLSIDVHSEVSGRLPIAIETTLYRVAQEALNNTVKHAKAKNVWIRAWRENRVLNCSIRDNGVGFDSRLLEDTSAPKGLGLVAMRERLSGLGGTLRIVSCPGEGTELSIRLPVEDSRGT
jgi:signal transduction histidine kinase